MTLALLNVDSRQLACWIYVEYLISEASETSLNKNGMKYLLDSVY